MGKQIRQFGLMKRCGQATLLHGALLSLVLAGPRLVFAQEGPLPAPMVPPAEVTAGDAQATNFITVGTSKQRVDLLLGTPPVGSTINCLHRSMYTYPDGTKVLLLDSRVISVTPGGLAEGDPAHGFIVKHDGKQVYIEPIALCGVPLPGKLGEDRHQAEESFIFGPAFHYVWEGQPLPWNGPDPRLVAPPCEPAKRIVVY